MEENTTPPPENKERKMINLPDALKKILPKLILILAGLMIAGIGYWAYSNYSRARRELSEYKDDPNVKAFKEKYDLLGRVSQHVVLPANEDPTIATITNAYRLSGQAFFTHAQNGDKVIIFPLAGRAILYRPSINKVIEAAPVNITDLEQSVSTDAITEDLQEVEEPASGQSSDEVLGAEESVEEGLVEKEYYQISVLNGTNILGLARDAAEVITDTYSDSEEVDVDITNIGNAVDVFSYTLIYYQEESQEEFAQELADMFEGRLTTDFPENEEEFNGDILIIRGQ